MRKQAEHSSDEPFGWQELAERVGDYLRAEGVPTNQTRRLSLAVIRRCADAADSVDRAGLQDSAMDEAQTVLATWLATRREHAMANA